MKTGPCLFIIDILRCNDIYEIGKGREWSEGSGNGVSVWQTSEVEFVRSLEGRPYLEQKKTDQHSRVLLRRREIMKYKMRRRA